MSDDENSENFADDVVRSLRVEAGDHERLPPACAVDRRACPFNATLADEMLTTSCRFTDANFCIAPALLTPDPLPIMNCVFVTDTLDVTVGAFPGLVKITEEEERKCTSSGPLVAGGDRCFDSEWLRRWRSQQQFQWTDSGDSSGQRHGRHQLLLRHKRCRQRKRADVFHRSQQQIGRRHRYREQHAHQVDHRRLRRLQHRPYMRRSQQ